MLLLIGIFKQIFGIFSATSVFFINHLPLPVDPGSWLVKKTEVENLVRQFLYYLQFKQECRKIHVENHTLALTGRNFFGLLIGPKVTTCQVIIEFMYICIIRYINILQYSWILFLILKILLQLSLCIVYLWCEQVSYSILVLLIGMLSADLPACLHVISRSACLPACHQQICPLACMP
jgi:hypothetical protein